MRTIIINYLDMSNLGGIEKCIFKLAIYANNHDIRFIWMHEKTLNIAKSFKSVLLGPKVERISVWSRDIHWFKHEKIQFHEGEKAIIVSFDPIGMARAEQFIIENPQVDIIPIYAIPDVTGNGYYLERFFNGYLYSLIKKRLNNIFVKWENAGQLRFFAKSQITALERNYNIKISNGVDKVIKPVEAPPKLDLILLEKRVLRNPFSIITVSRFDFPYKGYILGLVRAYGRLKKKYDNIKLDIIGYGLGERELREVINQLPEEVKSGITLHGEVSPIQINKYFEKASLNIGVSGAVFDGAKNGVLSIIARNWYQEECEVYGFLSKENRHMTTASSEGTIVDSLIEDVINMSDDEYKKLCLESYNVCNNDADPLYLWHTDAKSGNQSFSKLDLLFMKLLSYLSKIVARIPHFSKLKND